MLRFRFGTPGLAISFGGFIVARINPAGRFYFGPRAVTAINIEKEPPFLI